MIGVECGLQPYDDVIEKNKLLCSDPVLDQVIGSIHLVEKTDPYYPGFWEGRSTKDTIRLYLEATLKNIELFSDFDTMGHLDYAVRYCPQKGVYDPIEYIDIVDAIFEFLIKNDIAYGFDRAYEILKDIGFDSYSIKFFKKNFKEEFT